jgi:hypothetical protein
MLLRISSLKHSVAGDARLVLNTNNVSIFVGKVRQTPFHSGQVGEYDSPAEGERPWLAPAQARYSWGPIVAPVDSCCEASERNPCFVSGEMGKRFFIRYIQESITALRDTKSDEQVSRSERLLY